MCKAFSPKIGLKLTTEYQTAACKAFGEIRFLQEYIGLLLKLLAKFPYKFILDWGMLSFFPRLSDRLMG